MLAAGALVSTGLLALSLKQIGYERIPQAAMLAAAFFVASLVSIPLGPFTVHLLLNGLMGIVLGWASVPALFVALLLQAAFFGHGGILALGVNAANLALPALAVTALLPVVRRAATARRLFWAGATAGGMAVAFTGVLVAASLALSGREFFAAGKALLAGYVPLALLEAAVTGFALAFFGRVAPELLFPAEVRDG